MSNNTAPEARRRGERGTSAARSPRAPRSAIPGQVGRRAASNRQSHGFLREVLEHYAGGSLTGIDEQALRAQWLWLETDESVLGSADVGTELVLVESGLLAESLVGQHPGTLDFVERGQFGGNVLAMLGDARQSDPVCDAGLEPAVSYSYRAVAPSRVVLLDAERIGWLASRDPSWAEVRRRMTICSIQASQVRERERLTRSPDQRYVDLVDRRPDVAAQLTQREIARFLGVSEVTMSRMKSRVSGRG